MSLAGKVVVVGTIPPADLGLSGCEVLPDLAEARFDGPTETWRLVTPDGRGVTAGFVVDTRPSRDATVAAHGAPNYFRTPGPAVRRQARYVARCLRMAEQTGAGRIEAKRPIVLRRWLPRPPARRFYLSGSEPRPDDLYDGPATVLADGRDGTVSRVRLIGHLDPIDGRYHWQGTVFEPVLPGSGGQVSGLSLRIGERTCAARVVETTPWGTTMIAGVGEPPFDY